MSEAKENFKREEKKKQVESFHRSMLQIASYNVGTFIKMVFCDSSHHFYVCRISEIPEFFWPFSF